VQNTSRTTVIFSDHNSNGSTTSYKPAVTEKNQCVRFVVPWYYDRTRARISAAPYAVPSHVYFQAICSPATATNPNLVYASAADDFQCGYYLGAPPFDRPSNTVNGMSPFDNDIYNAIKTATVS
jgi:hypothetical protein